LLIFKLFEIAELRGYDIEVPTLPKEKDPVQGFKISELAQYLE